MACIKMKRHVLENAIEEAISQNDLWLVDALIQVLTTQYEASLFSVNEQKQTLLMCALDQDRKKIASLLFNVMLTSPECEKLGTLVDLLEQPHCFFAVATDQLDIFSSR